VTCWVIVQVTHDFHSGVCLILSSNVGRFQIIEVIEVEVAADIVVKELKIVQVVLWYSDGEHCGEGLEVRRGVWFVG
jgi:hypothetical protein